MYSAEIQRVRNLVMDYGWNAVAFQLVNPGISHWFSKSGDAVIGYVDNHRVRVVAGAPICDEEDLESVVEEFEVDSKQDGFCVCYFGAAGRLESMLGSRADYSTVLLGAQPVWNPHDWASLVDADASLRAQFNRARNKGVTITEWDAERATDHPALWGVLEQWLQTRGLPPLHFLVEPDTLSCLEDRRVFVAERNSEVIGFVIASPVPKRNGWLTEQFIRGWNAPNGTVELLIDSCVRALAMAGAEYVTMGLVPLSQQFRPPKPNPLWLRLLLAWVRAHGRRFYNFGGLDAFKSKFHPQSWEPIYAISNERRFSFRTLYAIAAAFSRTPPWLAVLKGMAKALGQEARWAKEALKDGVTEMRSHPRTRT